MTTDNGTTKQMKGGVRRPRAPGQSWTYIVDMGLQPAQRCEVCGRRQWVGARRLEVCPRKTPHGGVCGGGLRETTERRIIEKGGFETEQAAKFARADAISSLGRGDYRPPDRMTLATYLRDVWLPETEADGLKSTTKEGYARHVADHLIGPSSKPFPLGTMQLTRVTLKAIRAHYGALAEGYTAEVERKSGEREIVERKGLSSTSIRRVHATLHRALNVAVERRLIDRNPARGAARKLPGAPATREDVHFWQPAELQRFLRFVHDLDDDGAVYFPLWHLLANTGMRRGEALGLRWEDVDGACLTVRRNRVPLKGGVVEETTTKTKRQRAIDLDPETVEVLKRQRKVAQPAARLMAGPAWQDTGYVFTDTKGLPLDPGVVSWQFRLAVKMANAASREAQVAAGIAPEDTTDVLSPLSVHGLRHTHATIALQAGIPVTVVSKRLGHASVTMTLNVYSHALKGAQADLAATFAAVVSRGSF